MKIISVDVADVQTVDKVPAKAGLFYTSICFSDIIEIPELFFLWRKIGF